MKTVYMRKVSLIILMILCVSYPILATDYYVKADGSNSDGLSLGTAFTTLSKAITVASDNDVIYVSGTITKGVKIENRTLTIKGIGNDAVIDIEGAASRCFEVVGGDVELENLTMTRAWRNGNGGAISVSGSAKLSVIDCVFTNNASVFGTAIDAADSELYVEGCVFKSNGTDKSITGLLNDSRQTINIRGAVATTVIKASDFEENNGINSVITNNIGSLEIDACNFKNNTVTANNLTVVDIAAVASNLILRGCNFTNNSASAVVMASNESLDIRGCVFKGNKTTKNGGALNSVAKSTYIEGSSFVENESSGFGGAIWVSPPSTSTTFKMINTTVARNQSSSRGSGMTVEGGIHDPSNEYLFVNVSFINNFAYTPAKPSGDGNMAGLNFYDGGTFLNKVKIYNSIFEGNVSGDNFDTATSIRDIVLRSGKDASAEPDSQGEFLIKNSFIQYIYGNNGTGTSIINPADVVNSAVGGRNFGIVGQPYQASGLAATYDVNNYAYPLANISSKAYNFGDASLLSAFGYHTDQLKQYRSFTDGKCAAGAVEWIENAAILPTTSITATEIAGYSFGSLGMADVLTLTGSYTEDNFKNLQNALNNNAVILKLDFETFPATTINYFTEINPNCLKFVPAGTATEATWANYVAGISALTPIVLADGYPFSCPDAITATQGVTYTRNFSSDWETIALPFTVSNSTNISDFDIEAFSEINGSDEIVFDKVLSLDANTAYIIKNKGDVSQPFVFTGDAEVSVQTLIEDTDKLKGTYVEITGGATNGLYTLTDDGASFNKASAGTVISPFRAYLETISAKEAFTTKHDEGITTDILSLKSDNTAIYAVNGSIIINSDKTQLVKVYTIDGRNIYSATVDAGITKINNLQNGIYIVNNKKVIVK